MGASASIAPTLPRTAGPAPELAERRPMSANTKAWALIGDCGKQLIADAPHSLTFGPASSSTIRKRREHKPRRNPLAALWMACSPTPETLRHPPLCNDSTPTLWACMRRRGPQNLAGEVESLLHIMGWIAAPRRSAASPSVTVGVVIPAVFTISARGAVVVFAREKLDRATVRRLSGLSSRSLQ
jgi:hypothetical protein